MPQDPSPGPGQHDAEPPSSPPPPAAEDGQDIGQGLYLCTPPEQLTLAGFAQNGEADTMAPGPLLATVVDTVTGEDAAGLAGCSEDQLMGIISAARRMAARDEWIFLAAVAEFAARHPGAGPRDEFAPDELAFELHLTPLSAAEQMDYAATVKRRLPETFAALRAGRIHPVHLRIIADETSILSDEDAARADQVLAGSAPGMTFGEVRAAAHKLVLKLDPEAARKRKEAARAEAHVRPFREASGNGGMVARELPSDEVLASWQHVEQRALDLRAAGLPGTLRELRIRAYLDLLQERDSRDQPAGPAAPAAPAAGGGAGETGAPAGEAGVPDQPPPDSEPPDQPPPDSEPPDSEPPDSEPPDSEPPDSEPPGTDPGPGDPGGNGRGGPGGNGGSGGNGPGGPGAPGAGAASGPSLAALVTITIPWSTCTGRSETPGQADGFGPIDGDDARDLAAAAARHPRTRWCITAVNPDGTAAAHACLPGRHPPPGTGPPGTGPPTRSTPLTPLTPLTRGPCQHPHAETGYHPSRTLTHLIRARNGTCTAPGCRRPAARCDLDHTVPWDQGGMTCECDLAPLCRHHHRCKQAEGWQLEQPEPGVLAWRTPAGRRYATTPTQYPS